MTLLIHPANLPDGAVGFTYDQAFAGSGGTEPYEFTVSRGAPPTGVPLTDAILNGIATTPGAFTFTILMTDATVATAVRTYTVNILPLTPTIVVEDGSGVDGANSYLALTDLYTNQAALGIGPVELAALKKLNPVNQANLLVWGTAYLDRRFRFYGQPLAQGQSLQWPRTKNFDTWGYILDPGTVPQQLQRALALLATAAAANPKLLNVENTAFPLREKSWNLDGTSIEYADPPWADIKEGDVVPLFEQRLPDVLVLLRSIGELEDMTWVTTDRQTVVNR